MGCLNSTDKAVAASQQGTKNTGSAPDNNREKKDRTTTVEVVSHTKSPLITAAVTSPAAPAAPAPSSTQVAAAPPPPSLAREKEKAEEQHRRLRAVIKVQSVFRMILAVRRATAIADAQHKERVAGNNARRITSLAKVCAVLMKLLARVRLRKKLRLHAHTLLVNLKNSWAIVGSEGDNSVVATSHIFVYVHGEYDVANESAMYSVTDTVSPAYQRRGNFTPKTDTNNLGDSFSLQRRLSNGSAGGGESPRGSINYARSDSFTSVRSGGGSRGNSLNLSGAQLSSMLRAVAAEEEEGMGRRGGGGGGGDVSASDENTMSLYKSKPVSKCHSPEWDEECLVTNVTGFDKIAFTVVEHDLISGNKRFVGQAIIHLKDNPTLFSGEELNFEIPLEDYRCVVHDSKYRRVKIEIDKDEEPKGELLISVKAPDFRKSYAGWLMKQAGSALGFSKGFKMRYFIICDDVIKYFDDAHSLSQPRGTMAAQDVKKMQFGPDEAGVDTLEIESTKDVWYLQFPIDEFEVIKDTWLRKFTYCCSRSTVRQGMPDYRKGLLAAPAHESRPSISKKSTGVFSMF